jgi:hypothetical protein
LNPLSLRWGKYITPPIQRICVYQRTDDRRGHTWQNDIKPNSLALKVNQWLDKRRRKQTEQNVLKNQKDFTIIFTSQRQHYRPVHFKG